MALTAAQQKWLNEDNHRVILMDLQYHDGTSINMLRFSSYPYTMEDGDTTPNPLGGVPLANLIYDDIISSVPNITTRIDSDSTFGSIELLNTIGELDYLLKDVTVIGHSIKLYIGSKDWARDDFIPILSGVVSEISSSSIDKISLTVKDNIDKLDVPLQTNLIDTAYWDTLMMAVDTSTYIVGDVGGTRSYSKSLAVLPDATLNTHVPVCFGKCFNITPVLVDSFNHVYLIAEEGISSLDAVRADGVVLSGTSQYEVDLALGILRILDNSNGVHITCDVTGTTSRSSLIGGSPGYTPTTHSAAFIIEWLLLEKAALDIAELNATTFGGFNNTSSLGIYYTQDVTVLDTVTKIISSVGGFIRFNTSDATIGLYKFMDPLGEVVDLELINDDIIEGGVTISDIEEPRQSITLGYSKNWSVQDTGSLAGVLSDITNPNYTAGSEDTLNKLTTEYSTIYQDTGISTVEYPLAEHIDLIETFIFSESSANIELARRIGLRSQRRIVYKLQSIASSFTYNIGDIVNLTYDRYGFNKGKNGLIVSIEESLTTRRVTLEIWV